MRNTTLGLAVCIIGWMVPAAGVSVAAPPPAPVSHPANLILITIDTLRADYLGLYGGRARTPVLDELGRQGWHFADCYSTSMLTNPSHVSVMTSLYPRDHGVYDNESGVQDGVRTLARAAADDGLQTGAVINFPHLNPEVANLGNGFGDLVPATRHERRAPELTQAALQLIDRFEPQKGFFVWLHYTDPHAPYEPSPGRALPSRAEGSDIPMAAVVRMAPGFQRHNEWFRRAFGQYERAEDLIQRYVAEIEAADAGVGQLIDGLKARQLWDQTAVVVTADHGENMGEHNLFFHHGGLFASSVHVPLLIRLPKAQPARVAALTSTVDIAPTILELLQIPAWPDMRGRSLVPVARGLASGREFVFSEHMLAQQVAVRGHHGLMIQHRKTTHQFPSYPFRRGRVEIYDLSADPQAMHDLGVKHSLAQVLGPALQRFRHSGLRLAARPAVGSDEESLRALGYIE